MKDRNYGLANSYVHMYFNGATNIFKELPNYLEMNPDVYKSIINNQF